MCASYIPHTPYGALAHHAVRASTAIRQLAHYWRNWRTWRTPAGLPCKRTTPALAAPWTFTHTATIGRTSKGGGA